jgi:hypothetical protein
VSGHPPLLLRAIAATLHAGVFHEHPVCSWVLKCDTKRSKSSTTGCALEHAGWFRTKYNLKGER